MGPPRWMAGLLLLAATGWLPGRAQAQGSGTPPEGQGCLAAVQAAEQAARLPPGLLRGIALVESGRPDPATGRAVPWPWTINVGGTGRFFASREEAVAAVRALREAGVQSIDVGCTQVNLMHHPNAFETLEAAFEPRSNAAYAASFLRALYAAKGSWPLAAAAYHSQTPELGSAYAWRVMRAWPDAERYGPWPSPGAGGSPAAPVPVDYGAYTPAFAARLRRMDLERTRSPAALRPTLRPAGPVWVRQPPEPVPLLPPGSRRTARRDLRQGPG